MVAISTIAAVDFVLGTAAGLGLLYLLYSGSVVHYDRFFRIITAGLLAYAVTGLVLQTLEPALIHAVHGVATIAIAIGCYGLVSTEIAPEDDFAALFGPPEPGDSTSTGDLQIDTVPNE